MSKGKQEFVIVPVTALHNAATPAIVYERALQRTMGLTIDFAAKFLK